MSSKTSSSLLLGAAIIFAALAAVTLFPSPSSMLSDLGYFALCPFAPWSTLVLLLGTAVCWLLRGYLNRPST